MHITFWSVYLKEREHCGDLSRGKVRIILKWILERGDRVIRFRTNFNDEHFNR
jgi:hypothetical protein